MRPARVGGAPEERTSSGLRVAIHRPYASALDPSRYQVQELILARALAPHGIEATVFSRWADGVMTDHGGDETAVRLRAIRGPSPARHQTVDMLRVAEIARGGFDVIQVHEESQATNALLAWVCRAPIVLYQGAYIDSSAGAERQKRVLRATLGRRLRSRAVTVAKTGAAAARLAEWGYRPARVIPVGFDDAYVSATLDPRAPAALGLSGSYVLGVGALVERKRWPWAVEWCAAALAAGQSVALVLVGDGPEGVRVDELAAAVLPGRYSRFPRLSQAETLGLIAGAAALVHPSSLEEYGMVLLEALGLGTPVVALPTAGSDEMLRGPLAPSVVRDREEGARRLIALLERPEYRAVQAEAGRRAAQGRLSAAAMGDAFAALYRALASA